VDGTRKQTYGRIFIPKLWLIKSKLYFNDRGNKTVYLRQRKRDEISVPTHLGTYIVYIYDVYNSALLHYNITVYAIKTRYFRKSFHIVSLARTALRVYCIIISIIYIILSTH